MKPGWFPGVLVLSCAIPALYWNTDGLNAFTTEGARRHQVSHLPRELPDVALTDQEGKTFMLSDLRGRRLVVDFIYTRCPTVCRALGGGFQRLQAYQGGSGQGDDFLLLSISFDFDRDGVEDLARYASRYGADPDRWRIARVDSSAGLDALLQAFGITVIPDRFGGFEHNAALHIVSRDGKLVRILDYADDPRVREQLLSDGVPG